MLTRVPPKLPPELEAIVTQTIGCAIRVHKKLGPGFREGIYQDAMRVELTRSELRWDSELWIDMYYEGRPLRRPRGIADELQHPTTKGPTAPLRIVRRALRVLRSPSCASW